MLKEFKIPIKDGFDLGLDVVLEMMKPTIEEWIDKRAPNVQQADVPVVTAFKNELEVLKEEF